MCIIRGSTTYIFYITDHFKTSEEEVEHSTQSKNKRLWYEQVNLTTEKSWLILDRKTLKTLKCYSNPKPIQCLGTQNSQLLYDGMSVSLSLIHAVEHPLIHSWNSRHDRSRNWLLSAPLCTQWPMLSSWNWPQFLHIFTRQAQMSKNKIYWCNQLWDK